MDTTIENTKTDSSKDEKIKTQDNSNSNQKDKKQKNNHNKNNNKGPRNRGGRNHRKYNTNYNNTNSNSEQPRSVNLGNMNHSPISGFNKDRNDFKVQGLKIVPTSKQVPYKLNYYVIAATATQTYNVMSQQRALRGMTHNSFVLNVFNLVLQRLQDVTRKEGIFEGAPREYGYKIFIPRPISMMLRAIGCIRGLDGKFYIPEFNDYIISEIQSYAYAYVTTADAVRHEIFQNRYIGASLAGYGTNDVNVITLLKLAQSFGYRRDTHQISADNLVFFLNCVFNCNLNNANWITVVQNLTYQDGIFIIGAQLNTGSLLNKLNENFSEEAYSACFGCAQIVAPNHIAAGSELAGYLSTAKSLFSGFTTMPDDSMATIATISRVDFNNSEVRVFSPFSLLDEQAVSAVLFPVMNRVDSIRLATGFTSGVIYRNHDEIVNSAIVHYLMK